MHCSPPRQECHRQPGRRSAGRASRSTAASVRQLYSVQTVDCVGTAYCANPSGKPDSFPDEPQIEDNFMTLCAAGTQKRRLVALFAIVGTRNRGRCRRNDAAGAGSRMQAQLTGRISTRDLAQARPLSKSLSARKPLDESGSRQNTK